MIRFLFLICLTSLAFGQSTAPVRALDLFDLNYQQARDRFRASCLKRVKNSQDYCRTHQVQSGGDRDLTIDFGYFSNGGDRLLILESGIHGPEFSAGAAAQSVFMESYLDAFLSKGVDVLILHGLNPFGIKNKRRTDEYNVNLNRNFVNEVPGYSQTNPPYAKLRGIFEPQGKIRNVQQSALRNHSRLLWAYALRLGDKRHINQAMNAGQYEFSEGLNFGGKSKSQQMLFLEALLKPLFAQYSGSILFLDFHTGLGENGVLQVMNGLHPPKDFYAQLGRWLKPLENQGVKLVNANDTTDPNFYTVHGDVIDFVPTLSNRPDQVLALTLEYGTLGVDIPNQLKTASRIVMENQAHFHGCLKKKDCDEIRNDFHELFNPTNPEWRGKVVGEARLVFDSLLINF